MGREPLLDLLVIAGAAWLAVRLRRERRFSAATALFLPAAMLGLILVRRELVSGAAGAISALAALAGVFAGLIVATRSYQRVEQDAGTIVVRATRTTLLIWPGTIALYVLGRRAAPWFLGGRSFAGLDGVFIVFVVALIVAERGWLYHAYRDAVASERRPR